MQGQAGGVNNDDNDDDDDNNNCQQPSWGGVGVGSTAPWRGGRVTNLNFLILTLHTDT